MEVHAQYMALAVIHAETKTQTNINRTMLFFKTLVKTTTEHYSKLDKVFHICLSNATEIVIFEDVARYVIIGMGLLRGTCTCTVAVGHYAR